MDPKVLIVGTVPYNKATTARAFEAYFHGWDRACLAQIFSNSKQPVKGHCGKLFQITDKRMLQRVFDKDVRTGKEYVYEDLAEAWENMTQAERRAVTRELIERVEIDGSAISIHYRL